MMVIIDIQNIIRKNDIGEIFSTFIKTIKTIEIVKNKVEVMPILELNVPCFLISNAVIINRIDNAGKIQIDNTPSEKDKNQRIIVSAKINPPIIKSNSERRLSSKTNYCDNFCTFWGARRFNFSIYCFFVYQRNLEHHICNDSYNFVRCRI